MKKKIVCTLLALSMISGSVSACSSTKNDVGTTTETEDTSEVAKLISPSEVPLASYVEGIEDKEIKKGTEPTTITWMDDISWNKNYIKNIVVDFSGVNTKKAGTYDVHYNLFGVSGQIEVIDSSVKVVSVEKAKKKSIKKKSTKKAKKSKKSSETSTDKTSSSTETKSTLTTKNTTQGSSSTTKNTTTEKKSSTPKNNSSSGSSTKTEKKHEHNWKPIYKTVHHKAVTHQEDQGHYEKEAYDVYVFYDQGVEFDADDIEAAKAFSNSILQKIANGELPEDTQCRTRLEERYRKKWVSKMVTVVDKKAYDEKVIVGYKCSCGAKKNK